MNVCTFFQRTYGNERDSSISRVACPPPPPAVSFPRVQTTLWQNRVSMVLFRTRVHNADHNEHRHEGTHSDGHRKRVNAGERKNGKGVSTQLAVKTEKSDLAVTFHGTNRANQPSKKPLLTGCVPLSGTICSTPQKREERRAPHAGCDR